MMTSNCEIPLGLDMDVSSANLPPVIARPLSLAFLNKISILIVARKLHGDTLAALQEFYSEREGQKKRFQDLKSDIERRSSQALLSMDMFSEDWNTSQFWVCHRYLEIPSVV